MSKKSVIFGAILIFIGVILIANTLDWIWFDFGDVLRALIPIGLIVLGIWLIIRRSRNRPEQPNSLNISNEFVGTSGQVHSGPPPPPPPPPPPSPGEQSFTSSSFTETDQTFHRDTDEQHFQSSESPSHSQPGKLRYAKTFGDMYIDFKDVPMQNVEVSLGVSDLEAQLAGCRLEPGLNRLIISSFIGDVRLFIPKDLPCQAHCSNSIGDIDLAGRFSSGFGNNLECHTPAYEVADAKLYIAVNSFIGDIKIYSV
ncbi:MAG TPA: LiaF-related protein [candidate division Zixibacteria bacterium]|nr:LiaF-related protein [candidate division Zixibacteria bacterium]